MQIFDSGVRKRTRERLAVEVRIPSGAWKRAYVNQTFHPRPLEQSEELLERSRRMSDRVDGHGIGGPPAGGAPSPRVRSTRMGRSTPIGASCNASFAM